MCTIVVDVPSRPGGRGGFEGVAAGGPVAEGAGAVAMQHMFAERPFERKHPVAVTPSGHPGGMHDQVQDRPVTAGHRLPAHVYRRRRLLVAALVVAAAAVLAPVGLSGAVAGGATGRVDAGPTPTPLAASAESDETAAVYVVQPGDTLWSIARRLDPGADPRPLVAELSAANGGPVLHIGQRLAIPASLAAADPRG